MNYSTNAVKDGAMFPGREGFRARSHSSHDERAGHRQETPVRVQSESVRVSLSQTTLSYSSSSSNINMDQFYQELSARMGLPSSPSADSSKLNSTYTANGASYVKVPPISAEKVAENILGFVERRLTAESEAGASQEKLADLMAQARAGVKQGFGEATDQIKALGMMSDTLEEDIGKSFKLVNDGLDALAKRFLEGGAEAAAPLVSARLDERAALAAEEKTRVSRASDNASPNGIYQAGYSKQVGYDESLNLNVRTRDGDIVTIALRETGYSSESMQYAKGVNGEASSYEKGVYFSGEYSYQLEGELDEGELAALNELFDQVNEIAGLFYDGDFNEAFSYAMEMGFDSSELASFSLNMTQTQMTQVSAYEKVSGNAANKSLAPFGELASPALKAFESIEKLTTDISVLMDTLDFMLADKLPKRHSDQVEANLTKNSELARQYSTMVGNLMDMLPERLQADKA
jgi:hypothetical protein